MTGYYPCVRPERNTCVLVCDPDPASRRRVRAVLARRDALHVMEADTLEAATVVISRCAALLLSVGRDAEDAVMRFRAAGFEGTLVVALADGSVADAVAAMRAGADDVVPQPLKPEDVVDRLLAATPARRPDRRRDAPRPPPRRSGDFCGFLGRSDPMAALYDGITRMAASRAPVFITGESGAGKDLAAAAVHACSTRRDEPFETLSCRSSVRAELERDLLGQVRDATAGQGADRAGAIERARGGTLCLDEICDMDLELQAKLLGFLEAGRLRRVGEAEDREADVRIICTTGRDPLEEVRAGRLREDLFYRLHVLHLHMPPLRARGDDVILLAETFLARFAGEEGRPLARLGPEAAAVLRSRAFRGNVRELQNLMRRVAILLDGPVVPAHLVADPGAEGTAVAEAPPAAAWIGVSSVWGTPARVEPLSVVERRAIEAAISAFDGNIALAAAALDLSPSTLYRKKLAWQDGRRLS
ncbi:sigma-54-dependent Fis family transcriptional regulator [Xanthobacter dioxanivorans]|uniref:Sigma-54-dependent Fis family transcriptional regulator n=1 Tax=Xanthobacter dioxanivorans TaxID=2528964 RepID=A0A974PQB4_9HYPH|nr:sigma-54 dependent transcriptional regulator [Xanthobacter dioxanivorans]QRG07814.1 sigma-54-dependent Fis family transcriptional regulator [Xanthobacter dioxanivorans]